MKKELIVILLLYLILPVVCFAGHQNSEKYYQEKWCSENGGDTEVVLPDKTRCDCITTTNAIEMDFGPKWTEAVGQSLYYSLQIGKRAGIVLILEDKKDYKYYLRLNSVIQNFNLPIDVWKMEP